MPEHSLSDRDRRVVLPIRARRRQLGILPVYKLVDTCAAEFESYTPYYYSTYDGIEDEVRFDHGKERVMVLGGGPNRIGQGIEFDYCCVHAAMALREMGFISLMLNSNPRPSQPTSDHATLVRDGIYLHITAFLAQHPAE